MSQPNRPHIQNTLTPYTKINLKWIKDLNIRPETIELLEENLGKTLSDVNHSKILYDPSPRVMEIKAKINKWDLIKLKSFCTTKETISKVKRQPSEWVKIIANEITDTEFISKIYKPLQCSCLENPRDRGAWWAAVYGVAQSGTRLKRLSSSSRAA